MGSSSEEDGGRELVDLESWPVYMFGRNQRMQLTRAFHGIRIDSEIESKQPRDTVQEGLSKELVKNWCERDCNKVGGRPCNSSKQCVGVITKGLQQSVLCVPMPCAHFTRSFKVGEIACGGNHTLLTNGATGELYAFGANDFGQCSGITNEDISSPMKIDCHGLFVLGVAAGRRSSFCISGKRTVYAWGDNRHSQLGLVPEELKNLSRVESKQSEGKIEQAKEERIVRDPVLISFLSTWRTKQIAAGDTHTLALTMAGTVYAWGNNHHGQLGLGHNNKVVEPTSLPFFSGCRVVAIAVGATHSAAAGDTLLARHLEDAGNQPEKERVVFTWGNGADGRLGHGDSQSLNLPSCVQALRGKQVVMIACGEAHTVALLTSSVVYSWGNNMYGQLGMGDVDERNVPRRVQELANVVQVCAGNRHTVALQSSGVLYGWGHNYYGELGLGDFDVRLDPHPLLCVSGMSFEKVACGGGHTIISAVISDGQDAMGFGNSNLRHPLISVSNDSMTVTRTAQADGYSYIALAGPPMKSGKFTWNVLIEKTMSAEFDFGVGVAQPNLQPWLFDPFDQDASWLYLQSGKKLHMGDMVDYGEQYYQQDVIGVHLDMDLGTLRFSRRDNDLGVAFYLTSAMPLYLCLSLPGETDKATIIQREDEEGKERIPLDLGIEYCFNEIGSDKTSGVEVFYFCNPCKIRVCRACSRHCHYQHETELFINHNPTLDRCQCTLVLKTSSRSLTSKKKPICHCKKRMKK